MNSGGTKTFKVIVIGNSGVGKTTLTYRYCKGSFLEKPRSTIGVDFKEKTVDMGSGEYIKLRLWDTAGQETFQQTLMTYFYRYTDAIIFIYDVTDSGSFDSISQWNQEIIAQSLQGVPKILIGNKCECKKVVPTDVAKGFADHHNMLFFETSAKLDSQKDIIDSIFLRLAYELRNYSNRNRNSALASLQEKTEDRIHLRSMHDQKIDYWVCPCW